MALASTADGAAVVLWRWFDAVELDEVEHFFTELRLWTGLGFSSRASRSR